MAKRKDASGEKTVYPHVVMHSAARCCLGFAESTDDGSYYQSILCCLSLAFCLEAYFNFLGEEIIEAWTDDYERFSPKEKLQTLAAKIGYPLDPNSKTYDAFTRIFCLRKALVHGKVTSISGAWNTAAKGRNLLYALETEWEKLANPKEARSMYDRCSQLIKELHRDAGKTDDPLGSSSHGIGQVPFGG